MGERLEKKIAAFLYTDTNRMNQNDKQETTSGLVNAVKIYHDPQDDCHMTFEVGERGDNSNEAFMRTKFNKLNTQQSQLSMDPENLVNCWPSMIWMWSILPDIIIVQRCCHFCYGLESFGVQDALDPSGELDGLVRWSIFSRLRADECLEDVVVQIQREGDRTVAHSSCEGHFDGGTMFDG